MREQSGRKKKRKKK